MAEGYVLDTSSIVAYLYDEPGADIAEQAIFGGSSVSLPFLALMEVEYKLRRELLEEEEGKLEEKLAVLSHWPVTVVESNVTWRHEAARVKAQGKLSLADAWNAALALLQDAELVHKDPEFESVDGLKMLKLPYDRDATGKGQ